MGSIGAVDDVMAIVPALWARRCGCSTRNGTHSAADRGTDTGATPAACDRANDSSSAGTNQATA
jgi:hypothetical protein